MESEAPATQASHLNHANEGTHVTGNVTTGGGDFIGRDQNIQGDLITAEIGPGTQNVVVGSGNTQIIGYTAEQVVVILTQIRRADQPQGWNGRSPYIGLDSFSEQQAHLFFGRENLVTHLLAHVNESRFLCIAGPSGSGKSSLVQAGLIPPLRAGKLAGSEQWLFETVRPGNQPLENLALAMGRLAKSPTAADYFRRHGVSDPLTLHTQMETLLSYQLTQRAVIVVDQFEEIFTQTKDEALRLTFLALLTHAVQHTGGRVSVLLTMRSDFVSQCTTYADLRQLISGHLELVGAMAPEEVARAIAMPALEVGVEVKPDLVAQVINDMHGESGALPLMQFALNDLFDAQPKQPGKPVVLTLQEYLTRGGIHQALERHANAQFALFSPEEQSIARQIFMSLIEVGRGTVDTRRTTAFSELLSPRVDANQVERVVQTLANARLITTDNSQPEQATSAGGDTRNVTIAHEKLIEAWPWLQQMVRENRALIERQNQISEDAAEWNNHKQDASYLYTGARLQAVQEQLVTNQLTLSALAQKLIDASVYAEDKRLQEIEDERQRELEHQRALAQEQKLRAEAERQRAEEQTQAAQRLRRRNQWLGLALAGALLLTLITLLFFQQARTAQQTAETEKGRAEDAVAAQATEVINRSNAQATAEAERATAQRNAGIAFSRQLAAQSTSELNKNNYEIAILLAIESGKVTETIESYVAIRDALAHSWRSSAVLYGHRGPVTQATWSKDESKILTSSVDKTVRIWDAATGKELLKLIGVTKATWSKDESKILTSSDDHTVRIWEAATGKVLLKFAGGDWAVWNKDESKILTSSQDNTVRIWDAATGKALVELIGHTRTVYQATWSKDESKILTRRTDDHTVRIWEAATGKELVILAGHTGAVWQATWSKDESKILTSSQDNTVRIWDAATGKELVILAGHMRRVMQATWSKDESKILTSSDDHTVRIWEAATGKALVGFIGHTAYVMQATWSKDESKILTSSDDHTVRIWEAATGKELLKLTGHIGTVYQATWSKDESKILTGSIDNTVRIWEAATGKELVILAGHTAPGYKATWNKDESKILTFSDNTTVRIWEAATGKELLKLIGVTQATWSKDESKILTSSDDHTVRIWDAATGKELLKLIGVDWPVWSKDESKILTRSADTTIRIWEAATGKELLKLAGVTQATWSKDESKILTTSQDNTVRIWEAATGKALVELIGHTRTVMQATWSKDESKILTSSQDNTVRIWEAATGKVLVELTGHTVAVTQATWSKDESKILTSSYDNTVRIWEAATGKAILKLTGGDWAVWNKDESKILTASQDNTVRIWEAATGKVLVELAGHTRTVYQATWSKDESKILTRSDDTTIRIWEAATGKELLKLTGHTAAVYQATWSKDESKILTSSDDNTVRIWEAATGKALLKLTEVDWAVWNKDESKILTRSADTTIYIVYTRMVDLLAAACKWTPRNLTWNEWGVYLEAEDRKGEYTPACLNAPIPPDAIAAIQNEARTQIQDGQVSGGTQRLDQLNRWLQVNGQFNEFGVDVHAFVAEASATVNVSAPPTTTTPKPNVTPMP